MKVKNRLMIVMAIVIISTCAQAMDFSPSGDCENIRNKIEGLEKIERLRLVAEIEKLKLEVVEERAFKNIPFRIEEDIIRKSVMYHRGQLDARGITIDELQKRFRERNDAFRAHIEMVCERCSCDESVARLFVRRIFNTASNV